jgi:Tfp pilus assembly protein FimT
MKPRGISIWHGTSEAYSLTECVIVLMCATILISASVPNLSRLQNEWALWTAARMVESSLQWGRMYAITSNASMLFSIDADQQTFYWTDPEEGGGYEGTTHRLPGNVRFIASPRRPLRFYQHGHAAPAGTFTMRGDAGSYSVIVSPGGRIRVQKN